jgi:hypothetical protein
MVCELGVAVIEKSPTKTTREVVLELEPKLLSPL